MRPSSPTCPSGEVLESELVFEGRVWDVVRERFEFGDHELVREYVDHPGAVAMLALDEHDRVLVISQYRHPVRHARLGAARRPARRRRRGPARRRQRELAEEVDLAAERVDRARRVRDLAGRQRRVRSRVFEARGLSRGARRFLRTEEEAEIEVRWVELDELRRGGARRTAAQLDPADRGARRPRRGAR